MRRRNSTVAASRSWAVASNIERVILTGSGDFNVAGNGLANTLKGNSGDNWLNGSFGKDTLTGGAGRDSFIFNRALGPNNIDTITDYDVIRDVIRIDNAVFAGIGPAGALAVGMFNTGASATQADDRIIYDPATGKLFFDIDGAGGAAQIHFATLSTKPAGMSAGEFIII